MRDKQIWVSLGLLILAAALLDATKYDWRLNDQVGLVWRLLPERGGGDA
jgi:hypothetical protein